jgi:hypothetical protein
VTEDNKEMLLVAQIRMVEEGNYYSAYLCAPDGTSGESAMIVSMSRGCVDNDSLRRQFVNLARDIGDWAVEKALGEKPTSQLRKSEYGRDG